MKRQSLNIYWPFLILTIHGFRKKYSTNHVIISIVEKINTALSSSKYVAGVFLDFRKAYDTVNHSILLKKMNAYSIRGYIVEYPKARFLGPLLFLIYINDLTNVSKKLYSIPFADDTSVFIEGNNLIFLSTNINEEFNKLSISLASNKLTLNIEKSHYVISHRARLKQSNVNITLSNISFRKVLGVIIDEKLSFTMHISYIKSKISKAMTIIIKAQKYLIKKSLVNLYHSFVFPYLTYCITIWGNTSDIHLDTLI